MFIFAKKIMIHTEIAAVKKDGKNSTTSNGIAKDIFGNKVIMHI
jgi:hypothetical protein